MSPLSKSAHASWEFEPHPNNTQIIVLTHIHTRARTMQTNIQPENANVAELCRRFVDQFAEHVAHNRSKNMDIREDLSLTARCLCGVAKRKHHPPLISYFEGVELYREPACCCAGPDGLVFAKPSPRVVGNDHCAAALCRFLVGLQGHLKGSSGRAMAKRLEHHVQQGLDLRKEQYRSLKALGAMATRIKHAWDGEQGGRTQAIVFPHQHVRAGADRGERIHDKNRGLDGQHTQGTSMVDGSDIVTQLALQPSEFARHVDEFYSSVVSIIATEKQVMCDMSRRLKEAACEHSACPKAQTAFRSAFHGVVRLDDKHSNLDRAVFSGGQSDFIMFYDALETLLRVMRAEDPMTSTLSVRRTDKEWLRVLNRFESLRSDSMVDVCSIFDKYHALGVKVENLGDSYVAFHEGVKHGDNEGREAYQSCAEAGMKVVQEDVRRLEKMTATTGHQPDPQQPLPHEPNPYTDLSPTHSNKPVWPSAPPCLPEVRVRTAGVTHASAFTPSFLNAPYN